MNCLPDPYTYVLQHWWPRKGYKDPETGVEFRGRRKRIPEPHHSAVLAWLHQWTVSDVTILMGVKATPRGLIRTR